MKRRHRAAIGDDSWCCEEASRMLRSEVASSELSLGFFGGLTVDFWLSGVGGSPMHALEVVVWVGGGVGKKVERSGGGSVSSGVRWSLVMFLNRNSARCLWWGRGSVGAMGVSLGLG